MQVLRDERKRRESEEKKSKADFKKEEKTETIRKILSNLQLKNDHINDKSVVLLIEFKTNVNFWIRLFCLMTFCHFVVFNAVSQLFDKT